MEITAIELTHLAGEFENTGQTRLSQDATMARYLFSFLLALCLADAGSAQINFWQLGGGGLVWSEHDSTCIFVDFDSAPRAIQPIYLLPERTVFSYLDDWSPLRVPRDLGYVDGQRPRAWKGNDGAEATVNNAIYLVDGDSTTYNPHTSDLRSLPWYTIDVAVPVPAFRFGFFTPNQGYRSDGTPLFTTPTAASKRVPMVRQLKIIIARPASRFSFPRRSFTRLRISRVRSARSGENFLSAEKSRRGRPSLVVLIISA